MSGFVIRQSLLQTIIDHCRSVYPNEACGIIAGVNEKAEKIYKMRNIENSPVSYLMDPAEQFTVMKEMRKNSEKMIAIYHSHPHSQAYPSPKDVKLAFYTESIYLIVSLENFDRPVARAFKIIDGIVKELPIIV